MDLIVKFLFLSGKYITCAAGKTILELINHGAKLQRHVARKYDHVTQMVGPYDNMLELMNARLEEHHHQVHGGADAAAAAAAAPSATPAAAKAAPSPIAVDREFERIYQDLCEDLRRSSTQLKVEMREGRAPAEQARLLGPVARDRFYDDQRFCCSSDRYAHMNNLLTEAPDETYFKRHAFAHPGEKKPINVHSSTGIYNFKSALLVHDDAIDLTSRDFINDLKREIHRRAYSTKADYETYPLKKLSNADSCSTCRSEDSQSSGGNFCKRQSSWQAFESNLERKLQRKVCRIINRNMSQDTCVLDKDLGKQNRLYTDLIKVNELAFNKLEQKVTQILIHQSLKDITSIFKSYPNRIQSAVVKNLLERSLYAGSTGLSDIAKLIEQDDPSDIFDSKRTDFHHQVEDVLKLKQVQPTTNMTSTLESSDKTDNIYRVPLNFERPDQQGLNLISFFANSSRDSSTPPADTTDALESNWRAYKVFEEYLQNIMYMESCEGVVGSMVEKKPNKLFQFFGINAIYDSFFNKMDDVAEVIKLEDTGQKIERLVKPDDEQELSPTSLNDIVAEENAKKAFAIVDPIHTGGRGVQSDFMVTPAKSIRTNRCMSDFIVAACAESNTDPVCETGASLSSLIPASTPRLLKKAFWVKDNLEEEDLDESKIDCCTDTNDAIESLNQELYNQQDAVEQSIADIVTRLWDKPTDCLTLEPLDTTSVLLNSETDLYSMYLDDARKGGETQTGRYTNEKIQNLEKELTEIKTQLKSMNVSSLIAKSGLEVVNDGNIAEYMLTTAPKSRDAQRSLSDTNIAISTGQSKKIHLNIYMPKNGLSKFARITETCLTQASKSHPQLIQQADVKQISNFVNNQYDERNKSLSIDPIRIQKLRDSLQLKAVDIDRLGKVCDNLAKGSQGMEAKSVDVDRIFRDKLEANRDRDLKMKEKPQKGMKAPLLEPVKPPGEKRTIKYKDISDQLARRPKSPPLKFKFIPNLDNLSKLEINESDDLKESKITASFTPAEKINPIKVDIKKDHKPIGVSSVNENSIKVDSNLDKVTIVKVVDDPKIEMDFDSVLPETVTSQSFDVNLATIAVKSDGRKIVEPAKSPLESMEAALMKPLESLAKPFTIINNRKVEGESKKGKENKVPDLKVNFEKNKNVGLQPLEQIKNIEIPTENKTKLNTDFQPLKTKPNTTKNASKECIVNTELKQQPPPALKETKFDDSLTIQYDSNKRITQVEFKDVPSSNPLYQQLFNNNKHQNNPISINQSENSPPEDFVETKNQGDVREVVRVEESSNVAKSQKTFPFLPSVKDYEEGDLELAYAPGKCIENIPTRQNPSSFLPVQGEKSCVLFKEEGNEDGGETLDKDVKLESAANIDLDYIFEKDLEKSEKKNEVKAEEEVDDSQEIKQIDEVTKDALVVQEFINEIGEEAREELFGKISEIHGDVIGESVTKEIPCLANNAIPLQPPSEEVKEKMNLIKLSVDIQDNAKKRNSLNPELFTTPNIAEADVITINLMPENIDDSDYTSVTSNVTNPVEIDIPHNEDLVGDPISKKTDFYVKPKYFETSKKLAEHISSRPPPSDFFKYNGSHQGGSDSNGSGYRKKPDHLMDQVFKDIEEKQNKMKMKATSKYNFPSKNHRHKSNLEPIEVKFKEVEPPSPRKLPPVFQFKPDKTVKIGNEKEDIYLKETKPKQPHRDTIAVRNTKETKTLPPEEKAAPIPENTIKETIILKHKIFKEPENLASKETPRDVKPMVKDVQSREVQTPKEMRRRLPRAHREKESRSVDGSGKGLREPSGPGDGGEVSIKFEMKEPYSKKISFEYKPLNPNGHAKQELRDSVKVSLAKSEADIVKKTVEKLEEEFDEYEAKIVGIAKPKGDAKQPVKSESKRSSDFKCKLRSEISAPDTENVQRKSNQEQMYPIKRMGKPPVKPPDQKVPQFKQQQQREENELYNNTNVRTNFKANDNQEKGLETQQHEALSKSEMVKRREVTSEAPAIATEQFIKDVPAQQNKESEQHIETLAKSVKVKEIEDSSSKEKDEVIEKSFEFKSLRDIQQYYKDDPAVEKELKPKNPNIIKSFEFNYMDPIPTYKKSLSSEETPEDKSIPQVKRILDLAKPEEKTLKTETTERKKSNDQLVNPPKTSKKPTNKVAEELARRSEQMKRTNEQTRLMKAYRSSKESSSHESIEHPMKALDMSKKLMLGKESSKRFSDSKRKQQEEKSSQGSRQSEDRHRSKQTLYQSKTGYRSHGRDESAKMGSANESASEDTKAANNQDANKPTRKSMFKEDFNKNNANRLQDYADTEEDLMKVPEAKDNTDVINEEPNPYKIDRSVLTDTHWLQDKGNYLTPPKKPIETQKSQAHKPIVGPQVKPKGLPVIERNSSTAEELTQTVETESTKKKYFSKKPYDPIDYTLSMAESSKWKTMQAKAWKNIEKAKSTPFVFQPPNHYNRNADKSKKVDHLGIVWPKPKTEEKATTERTDKQNKIFTTPPTLEMSTSAVLDAASRAEFTSKELTRQHEPVIVAGEVPKVVYSFDDRYRRTTNDNEIHQKRIDYWKTLQREDKWAPIPTELTITNELYGSKVLMKKMEKKESKPEETVEEKIGFQHEYGPMVDIPSPPPPVVKKEVKKNKSRELRTYSQRRIKKSKAAIEQEEEDKKKYGNISPLLKHFLKQKEANMMRVGPVHATEAPSAYTVKTSSIDLPLPTKEYARLRDDKNPVIISIPSEGSVYDRYPLLRRDRPPPIDSRLAYPREEVQVEEEPPKEERQSETKEAAVHAEQQKREVEKLSAQASLVAEERTNAIERKQSFANESATKFKTEPYGNRVSNMMKWKMRYNAHIDKLNSAGGSRVEENRLMKKFPFLKKYHRPSTSASSWNDAGPMPNWDQLAQLPYDPSTAGSKSLNEIGRDDASPGKVEYADDLFPLAQADKRRYKFQEKEISSLLGKKLKVTYLVEEPLDGEYN